MILGKSLDNIKLFKQLSKLNTNFDSTKLNEIITNCLKSKNILIARLIIGDFSKKANVNDLINMIYEHGKPIDLAKTISFIDQKHFKLFEAKIIKSKNDKALFLFAIKTKDNDVINTLINFSIKNNKYSRCHDIVRYLPYKNINVNKFTKAFIESKNPRFCYFFAKTIEDNLDDKNFNKIKKLQQVCIDSKQSNFIRLFATHIKNANFLLLERAIANTTDIKQKQLFLKRFPNALFVKKSLLLY